MRPIILHGQQVSAIPDEAAAPLASALVRARRAGSGRRVALSNGTASGSVIPLMDRRAFLGTLTGGLLAAPLIAEAQQTGVYRVGFVSPAPGLGAPSLGFNRSLRESGLIEGENVVVHREFMGGREDQYPAVLGDLERRVDVIVVTGPPAALAAKKVVTRVPVIFAAGGDPVTIGLVQSLAKPGGNFTGVAFDVSPDIAIKRFGLLKEIFPGLVRVAALWSSHDPVGTTRNTPTWIQGMPSPDGARRPPTTRGEAWIQNRGGPCRRQLLPAGLGPAAEALLQPGSARVKRTPWRPRCWCRGRRSRPGWGGCGRRPAAGTSGPGR